MCVQFCSVPVTLMAQLFLPFFSEDLLINTTNIPVPTWGRRISVLFLYWHRNLNPSFIYPICTYYVLSTVLSKGDGPKAAGLEYVGLLA